jgi:arylsulfatase
MVELLDELGIAEDTFVMYSTDNGPHRNSWPDGATTPFLSEKDTNWEGAFHVPLLVRWHDKIKADSISNGIATVSIVIGTIATTIDWLRRTV